MHLGLGFCFYGISLHSGDVFLKFDCEVLSAKPCCNIFNFTSFHSVWMPLSLISNPNLNIKQHMFISLTVSNRKVPNMIKLLCC